ncbi:unnamed protein product [Brassicogethes aeneus]|uniref:Uncharacterized protein n=1 Tax=Brassicogethes aeneus TaxID=1431903 RepID=A0A9P0B039_BRAAE|nr:unnamed protein product [Brassicogethes aeneus]
MTKTFFECYFVNEMSCFRGLLNVFFQILNILFCLAGVGLIALGGIIFMVLCTNDNSKPGQLVPILLVLVGLVIFYISITGFVGSCMENTSMLITYSVTLLVILIIQVGLGTFAYIKIRDEKIQLQELLRVVFQNIKQMKCYSTWPNQFVMPFYFLF